MKKLTIIIPTYNRASCLKDCLLSIIVSIKKFENRIKIVVSDHASTDETEKVVKSIINNNFKKVKFIKRKKNEFTDIHFTKIIEEVNSDYFWLIGDDDKIAPNAIKEILKYIDKGIGLIYCNYSIWSKNFDFMINKNGLARNKNIYFNDHNKLLEEIAFNMSYISCVITKKDNFVKIPKIERKKYFGFTVPCTFPLYLSQLNNCNAMLLSNTIVMNRSGNNDEKNFKDIHGSSWHKIYVTGSWAILSGLKEKGFAASSVRKAHIRVLVDYVIPQTINLRINKFCQKGSLMFLFKYYKTYLLFYVAILPILIIPNFVVNMLSDQISKLPFFIKKLFGTKI
tara:strand:+ start:7987 stop:9003 length:1017 start_codon:yes stop_codon:yes gene_type:complete